MTAKAWITFGCGVAVGAGVATTFGATAGATRVEAAQAGTKYESRIVLENDLVRVKDVTFPVGVADTGMHTHDLAHVGVIITPGALAFTDQDGKKEVVEFQAGSVGFREANARHMAANPGTRPMRVIEVEIKR